MPVLQPRRKNCLPRTGCSDDSVRKDENRMVAIVPANPWRKIYALGLALRSKEVAEGTLVLCLDGVEISACVGELLHQRLSIIELGKRDGNAPHTSITVSAV